MTAARGDHLGSLSSWSSQTREGLLGTAGLLSGRWSASTSVCPGWLQVVNFGASAVPGQAKSPACSVLRGPNDTRTVHPAHACLPQGVVGGEDVQGSEVTRAPPSSDTEPQREQSAAGDCRASSLDIVGPDLAPSFAMVEASQWSCLCLGWEGGISWVDGAGAAVTDKCGWTRGLGLASGSCPGPGVDTRGPVRAHSPSALLGQVGRLEEAAGAAVLRAGVHGQAWSEVLSGPCWDGPAGGDGTAGPHGPSAASSLSSPPLENPVSPGPGSGEAKEQMACLGGLSRVRAGLLASLAGPRHTGSRMGDSRAGVGRMQRTRWSWPRAPCCPHAGSVLAPGCPALGPEGSRTLLPSAPREGLPSTGLADLPSLRLCGSPRLPPCGGPGVDSVGQLGAQEEERGVLDTSWGCRGLEEEAPGHSAREGGAPWVLRGPTPWNHPWFQKHLCLCGNLRHSSRHLPTGPAPRGNPRAAKQAARSQENPSCPAGLVPFPAKDKHGDQHVPFLSGWQEARGWRSGMTTVTSLSLPFRVLSLCHSLLGPVC